MYIKTIEGDKERGNSKTKDRIKITVQERTSVDLDLSHSEIYGVSEAYASLWDAASCSPERSTYLHLPILISQ